MLVLEGKLKDFVDKRAKYWGFSFPEKVNEWNRSRLFEYRYEYRDPEYKKTMLRPTRTPEQPRFVGGIHLEFIQIRQHPAFLR